ncbi:KH domain protein [Moelleriella libera RCEF 2490]|uniref:KH domain protein n=1 Tax=Moelleriella libera RCEF 2490 TaxID=1081109 RepID=A0A168E5I0_9HYPO|nr:KH domain protein [Moelleriella libera RCEF 2490]
MDDSERRTVKRSRFDQTEPEPKRASRFDRRSRSPPARRSEGRDRSPLAEETAAAKKSPVDAAAAAAAAAARINAAMQARKNVQHADTPPTQGSASPGGPSAEPKSHSVSTEMYVADGDYIQDIEVNDLRNRYLVTKGSTRKMITDETGADITLRGKYWPNKAMATAANPPLYLHITSTTKEGLDAAVAKVNEMIQQELPQLVDERRFRRRDQEPQEPERDRGDRGGDRDQGGRRKWPEERIAIDLEPVYGFNLRAQIVGHGGSYVKHIQQETGCRVQIKGRGSGYLEGATNQESDEDMYLHVAGPDAEMVEKGKSLCEDLVANVKQQYEEFKSRPPRYNDRGGHHGGDRYRGGSDRHHYDRGHSSYSGGGGGGGGGYGSEHHTSTHSPAQGTDSPGQNAVDYSAAYAQYYGGADPYAAYGGYANYVAMYQQYYAQSQGQAAPAAPATSASPPPPPPNDAAPPPPPPASAAPPPPPPSASPPGGSYSAVPPPPGL